MARMKRNQLMIAGIHAAARALGMDDETRRGFFAINHYPRSCADMDNGQLSGVLDMMNRLQAGEVVAPDPEYLGKGPRAPTRAQWALFRKLAKGRGWEGPHDKRARGFIKRTTGLDALEWVDRGALSDVITGLKKWGDA